MKHKFQRILAVPLALALLTIPAAASSFPDVPDGAAYAEAAEYLNDVGIMQGDTQGNFNPDRNVTRAQMAAILCRMLGETENLKKDGTVFTDVPESYWANETIVKAAELGIIGGYRDGTFKPDSTVTYEQAVTMIVRAMGLEELATEYGGYPNGHIKVADERGFIWGLSISNGVAMTRGQISIMVYRTQV